MESESCTESSGQEVLKRPASGNLKKPALKRPAKKDGESSEFEPLGRFTDDDEDEHGAGGGAGAGDEPKTPRNGAAGVTKKPASSTRTRQDRLGFFHSFLASFIAFLRWLPDIP